MVMRAGWPLPTPTASMRRPASTTTASQARPVSRCALAGACELVPWVLADQPPARVSELTTCRLGAQTISGGFALLRLCTVCQTPLPTMDAQGRRTRESQQVHADGPDPKNPSVFLKCKSIDRARKTAEKRDEERFWRTLGVNQLQLIVSEKQRLLDKATSKPEGRSIEVRATRWFCFARMLPSSLKHSCLRRVQSRINILQGVLAEKQASLMESASESTIVADDHEFSFVTAPAASPRRTGQPSSSPYRAVRREHVAELQRTLSSSPSGGLTGGRIGVSDCLLSA